MEDNRCVSCGEIIPEGRMICPNCNSKIFHNENEHRLERGGIWKWITDVFNVDREKTTL